MKRKEAIVLLVITFIAILAWIVFSILDSAVSSTISEGLNIQIAPISATFDTKTIDALKKRNQIESTNAQAPSEENQASQSAKLLPSPTLIPTISLSPATSSSGSGKTQQSITP